MGSLAFSADAFSPDRRRLVSVSEDRILVWALDADAAP
jgi:hypothetical protein